MWDIFVELGRVTAPCGTPDEARIAAALPRAETYLQALAEIGGDGPWLTGPILTPTDLRTALILAHCRLAAESVPTIGRHPAHRHLAGRNKARPGLAASGLTDLAHT